MQKKIRWALVGCGRISKNHLEAVQKLGEDFEIVAVCDTEKDRADTAASLYNCKAFYNLEALLAFNDFELVSLCTPSGLHSPQSISLLRAQKHVISEKPMAVNWEDGLAMFEAAKASSGELFVVKQNRFNETVQQLKKAIDQGRFGQLYMINANVFWTRPQEYYDQAPWRGTWAMDGGCFMNQASHYVDLLQYLFGPILRVSSFTKTLARKIEAEDSGVVNIEWKNGALGSLNVSMLCYPKNLEGSICVLGEKATARLTGPALNKFDVWQFADEEADDAKVFSSNYETESVYGFGHEAYYRNIADHLLRNQPALVDAKQGLESLNLLCAIYQSARSGQITKLQELPL